MVIEGDEGRQGFFVCIKLLEFIVDWFFINAFDIRMNKVISLLFSNKMSLNQ